ncbi:YbbR-like domain-containing protein [Treponema sp. C6A8]|uniref:CdaR family protein n=1 Tax=Treponema sp. C6A8 TaxID=1410609 RepID=UPI0004853B8B|nr:CdaR family protein [Treponema sp. C6A8]
MSIRQLIEKVMDKWPAKIICFLLAIFLYVFHQISLVEKKSFVVPLNIIENGMVSHVSQLPSSVSVVVRAKAAAINVINTSDITAFLDLDSITEVGNYDLPVKIKVSDRLMEFDPMEIKVVPEVISTKIEIKKARFVKIKPTLVGEVAHGYEVSNVEVVPSYAEVIGSESIVNKLEEIETTKVLVSNAIRDFSTEAEYMSVNKLLDVVDKGPYKVTVTVKPSDLEKVFDEVAVLPVHLNKRLTLVKEIPSVSIKLKGSMLNLEKYSPAINAVTADLSKITEPGIYDIPLVFNIPKSFLIMEKSNEVVTVQVDVIPENSEQKEDFKEVPKANDAVNAIDFSGGAV